MENIRFDISTILEVGCGEGQLTIPFAHKISKYVKNFKLIAYDLSIGPYSRSIENLKKKIQEERLDDSIFIIQGDVKEMKAIEDESID
ncbi:MAG: methyltransferase domain-containing protein, partial [Candidatus Hodarchaeota archaeon]